MSMKMLIVAALSLSFGIGSAFAAGEMQRPEIHKPEIQKPEIHKPEIHKPEFQKPEKIERVEKPERHR